MSYKVLIIDDEPIIRKGLTSIMNWSQLGCEICGEASDGVAGEEMIKRLRPDIILTDIRMPKADGFTMIRQVKESVPQSKIIILTGYRDFDYAQEAVKLGAFDFILKPTKIGELTKVVQRAVQTLEQDQHKNTELQHFKELYEKNIPLLREKLLYNLIYGLYMNDSDIEEQMERFGLTLGPFIMGIIDNESQGNEDSYALQLYQFGMIGTLEEVLSNEFSFLSTPLNSRWLLFVAKPTGGEELNAELLHKKLTYLQEMIENCFSFTVSIALSSIGTGYKDLPVKFRECQTALEHRFYLGGNAIIAYQDMEGFFRLQDHSLLEQKQKQLLDQIKAGNQESALETVETIGAYVKGLRPDQKASIKSFYLNTLFTINTIRQTLISGEGHFEGQTLTSLYPMVESCENIMDLNDILREAARKAAENVYSYNHKSMKLLLKNAVEYLKEHYQEPLTLNDVADKLYVSTFYLSRMFKKELCKNFVDYLNEIRIEKAKELLKDIRYKTYEVADAIGINDPHYFSKLFKKYVGVTPTEYKESLKH
ncbi:MAG: response regulator [Clostridia bacterium]|nr:response regulator [Clostridia bacterium]